jgi:hypothetical protein
MRWVVECFEVATGAVWPDSLRTRLVSELGPPHLKNHVLHQQPTFNHPKSDQKMHFRGSKVQGESESERAGRNRNQFTGKRPRTPSPVDTLDGTIGGAFKRQKHQHYDPTDTPTKGLVQGIIAYTNEKVPKEVRESKRDIFYICEVYERTGYRIIKDLYDDHGSVNIEATSARRYGNGPRK